MYTSILVATDGSELSHKAVTSGIDLAALTRAKLVIVKVVPRYARSYFEGSIPVSLDDSARIEEQWIQDAQQVINAYQIAAEDKGVQAEAPSKQSLAMRVSQRAPRTVTLSPELRQLRPIPKLELRPQSLGG